MGIAQQKRYLRSEQDLAQGNQCCEHVQGTTLHKLLKILRNRGEIMSEKCVNVKDIINLINALDRTVTERLRVFEFGNLYTYRIEGCYVCKQKVYVIGAWRNLLPQKAFILLLLLINNQVDKAMIVCQLVYPPV